MHPVWMSITKTPLLTRYEAAEALHQSLRAIDNIIADGSLKVVRIGRSVRIRRETLEDFVDSRESSNSQTKEASK
jgi:excisionase family DNA binding protein